jgi:hypothetical protein
MPTIASAVVKISADIGDFDKGLQKAQKALLKTADEMSAFGRKLSISFTAPLLAASAALAKSAAEDSASVRKLEAAFGSGSAAMEKFVGQMMKVAPVTDDQLRSIVANTQAFNLSLGMTPAKAQAATQAITKLAADIAAYNGVDIATAQEAITSAMAGRTKALKSLNVVVSEAEVKERGLAAITEHAAVMNGYAAKTIGDDVNAWARFKQSLDSASDSMGQAVLPLFSRMLDTAGKFAQRISEADKNTKDFAVSIGITVAAIGPLLSLTGALTRAWVAMQAALLALMEGGFAALAAMLGPAAVVLAGLTALGVLIYKSGEAARIAKQEMADYAASLGKVDGALLKKQAAELNAAQNSMIARRSGLSMQIDALSGAHARDPQNITQAGQQWLTYTTQARQLDAQIAALKAPLDATNAAVAALTPSSGGVGGFSSDLEMATTRAQALADAVKLLRDRNMSVIGTVEDMQTVYQALQKQIDDLQGKTDTTSIGERNKLMEAQNRMLDSAALNPAAMTNAQLVRFLGVPAGRPIHSPALAATNRMPTQNVDPWTWLGNFLPKKMSDTEKALRAGLADVSVAIGQTLADKLLGGLVGHGGGANFGGNLGGQFGERLGTAAIKDRGWSFRHGGDPAGRWPSRHRRRRAVRIPLRS